jgi:hypothetical protein
MAVIVPALGCEGSAIQMRATVRCLTLLIGVAVAATVNTNRAVAQAIRQPVGAVGPVGATTIQLPTFNFFAISTSVEVPDSGEGFMGGVNSATSATSQRGLAGIGFVPFSNRADASGRSGGGVSVRATIHDFDAMDKALLGADLQAATGSAASTASSPVASMLATDAAGGTSIAEIRRQQAAEDATANVEAQRLFDEAAAYEAAGRTGLAKINYRMAANHARGELKLQAVAALQKLNSATQPALSTGQ